MKRSRISLREMVFHTFIIFLIGILLGVCSKYLDHRQTELPYFLMMVDETLDLHNFLGRFPFWILIAICIAVYSNSSIRSAINVFVFFSGMITSYYLYSKFIAGFFPKSYALIWIGFTIISPFLAFICWYAKGNSHLSLILSSMIIAVLFNMTFSYGWLYFDLYSALELMVLICALVVLKRNTVKDTIIMIALGVVIAPVLDMFLPFRLW